MGKQEGRADAEGGGGGGPDAEGGGRVTEILRAASHLRDSLRRPPPSLDVCVGSCCGRREGCVIAAMSVSFMQPITNAHIISNLFTDSVSMGHSSMTSRQFWKFWTPLFLSHLHNLSVQCYQIPNGKIIMSNL